MAYGALAADAVQSSTAGTPPVFKDGAGTESGKLARAWVNYNASSQTITGSFNVGSVTRVQSGVFTINFSNALPNANYAYNVNMSPNSGYAANPGIVSCNANGQASTLIAPTASAFTFTCYNLGASNFIDPLAVNVIVLG